MVDPILAKYLSLGKLVDGDVLLAPSVALQLVDELGNADVAILGVSVWYAGSRPEELYCVDLSHLTANETISAARDFVSRWLSDTKHLISLVTALGGNVKEDP